MARPSFSATGTLIPGQIAIPSTGEIWSCAASSRRLLVSANTADILCDVSAARHTDGRVTQGAELLWIVPNGEVVAKGDLLVEFGSSLLLEIRDDWQLKALKSKGILQQASLRLENLRSKRDTELANATDKLELILTVKAALDDIHKLHITELIEVIKEARQGAKVAEIKAKYVEEADRLGLADSNTGTPEQARLNHQLELNDLGRSLGEFVRLTKYDHPLEAEELAAAAVQTRRILAQSQRNHEATMQQLLAQKNAAQETFDKAQERVDYYEQQLASCSVHAAFGGVVEHAPNSDEEETLAAGIVLRKRQKVLTLHDLTQLQLVATVHTPEARQLKRGMVASIYFSPGGGTADSGTVTDVRHSDTHTDVVITPDEFPRLRPGTLADVEIVLERRSNVVRIPLESLIQWNGESYCYLLTDAGLEKRPLSLGVIGPHYAEVLSGLQVGEIIVHDAASFASTTEGGN